MRIELACGAQFGGGVCAWHRGGGDAAYARSEARTNEGHGTSTLKATGHAYMLSPSCLRVWVYYSRGARLVLHQVALVKWGRSSNRELEGTTARYFTERPRSKVSL